MTKKKVLIINQGHVAGNLGDMAIRNSMGNLFEDMDYQVDFSFFNPPSATLNKEALPEENYLQKEKERRGKKKASIKKSIKGYLSIFYWYIKNRSFIKDKLTSQNFDAFVFGGGQLINSIPDNKKYPHLFCVALFWWTYMIRKYSKAPIYLVAVGVEGQFNRLESFLYRKALKRVKTVWVRDSFSKKVIFEELGKESTVIPDIAFYRSVRENNSLAAKRKLALVGVYDYRNFCFKFNKEGISLEGYYNQWYSYIKKYKAKGFVVKLFYSTKRDAIESKNFQSYIKKTRGEDIPIADISDLDDLYNLFSKTAVVYSARMHALLLALKYGCKVKPYVISQKIKSFYDEYIKTEKSPKMFNEEIKNIFRQIQLVDE